MKGEDFKPAIVTDPELSNARDEIGEAMLFLRGVRDCLRCLYSTSPMALTDEILHCLAYCMDAARAHLDAGTDCIESKAKELDEGTAVSRPPIFVNTLDE